MSVHVNFEAKAREVKGKGAARAIRSEGGLPINVYASGKENKEFSISLRDFTREYQKGAFKTKLVEFSTPKGKLQAIAKDIQLHPVTDTPIHVDFIEVDENTNIKTSITVKVINEDKSPGVKKGGIVNIVHRSIDFYCHPSSIIPVIEVNIDGLEIGRNVHVNDLNLPKGLTPIDKSNFTVVSIVGRTEESATTSSEA
jgi:large subunit ribosomal protein L25